MTLRIEWQGEILAKIGYGSQARRILKPLIEAGVDVKLLQKEDYVPDNMRIGDIFWLDQLENSRSKPEAPIRICYEIPPISDYRPDAINCAYCVWETDKYPREWIPKINNAQAFFTDSQALIDSARNGGVSIPAYQMAPPIDIDKWCPEGPTISVEGIKDTDVVFMMNGNWIPRKNFGDLMVGFCCALNGIKDAHLIIKTWGGDNSANFKKQVRDNVASRLTSLQNIDRPRIFLIPDVLEENQVIKLMRRADVYITVSHGEGFDLPLAQAMSMEKVCLATDFLSHGDYMTTKNSIPIKYSLMPVVDAKARNYTADQMWSRPDVGDMMAKVREAYKRAKNKDQEWREIGRKARETVVNKYNKKVTTKKIIDALEEILKSGKEGQRSSLVQAYY